MKNLDTLCRVEKGSERYVLHVFDLISFLIESARCIVIVEGIKFTFCLCTFKNWNPMICLQQSALKFDKYGEHLP